MYDPNGQDPSEGISHMSYRNTGTTSINIGVGTTGNTTLQAILAPNTTMTSLPFRYDTGQHIFIQATTGGTISSGVLVIDFYQTRYAK